MEKQHSEKSWAVVCSAESIPTKEITTEAKENMTKEKSRQDQLKCDLIQKIDGVSSYCVYLDNWREILFCFFPVLKGKSLCWPELYRNQWLLYVMCLFIKFGRVWTDKTDKLGQCVLCSVDMGAKERKFTCGTCNKNIGLCVMCMDKGRLSKYRHLFRKEQLAGYEKRHGDLVEKRKYFGKKSIQSSCTDCIELGSFVEFNFHLHSFYQVELCSLLYNIVNSLPDDETQQTTIAIDNYAELDFKSKQTESSEAAIIKKNVDDQHVNIDNIDVYDSEVCSINQQLADEHNVPQSAFFKPIEPNCNTQESLKVDKPCTSDRSKIVRWVGLDTYGMVAHLLDHYNVEDLEELMRKIAYNELQAAEGIIRTIYFNTFQNYYQH